MVCRLPLYNTLDLVMVLPIPAVPNWKHGAHTLTHTTYNDVSAFISDAMNCVVCIGINMAMKSKSVMLHSILWTAAKRLINWDKNPRCEAVQRRWRRHRRRLVVCANASGITSLNRTSRFAISYFFIASQDCISMSSVYGNLDTQTVGRLMQRHVSVAAPGNAVRSNGSNRLIWICRILHGLIISWRRWIEYSTAMQVSMADHGCVGKTMNWWNN